MAFVKPEMKSFIWLQTPDDSIQQVEEEIAMFCPMICREVLRTGMGSSKNYAIKLPQRVNPAALGLILDYCRFHQVAGRSNKERKTFDEKFIRLDADKLCDLISAADSLQLRPLVDLTASALARMISGKSAEEIRETFHIADDLTEEEKLEPLKIKTDDPRIRLLNTLYARKRKELKARETSKNVEVEEERVDDRSVDDLLLFINSGKEDSKGVKSTKNKKKNRRRKDRSKDHSSNTENRNHNKETDSLSSSHNSEIEDLVGSASPEFDFDDDMDPALMEELDREVEEFAQRLNSVWLERVQGIISYGQDRSITTISRESRRMATQGMHTSKFCLHPAGDTPSACRLFDAIVSLCVPVIISDFIELPFEDVIDYRKIAVFVDTDSAVKPGYLAKLLRGVKNDRILEFQTELKKVRHYFEYDDPEGTVKEIWRQVSLKLPLVNLMINRDKRLVKRQLTEPDCSCVCSNQSGIHTSL